MEAKSKYINIIRPSTGMFLKPDYNSILETECLFGETIKIIDQYKNWVYCRLLTDNYTGWVNKKDLKYISNPTHRVISKRSFLYLDNDIKSQCLQHIPMGAQLSVKNIVEDWAEIQFPGYFRESAYLPNNDIIKINEKINDWVAFAEGCIGTPYRWGGRDTIGLDCSALLQLSYQIYGESIPRNTSDQIKLNKKTINNFNNLRRGFTVFWDGHVAIMTDKTFCVHANAFHMKTTKEPLQEVIKRMGTKYPIVKIMDFN